MFPCTAEAKATYKEIQVDLCPARAGVATEASKQPGTSDMRIKELAEAEPYDLQMICDFYGGDR